jgi:hypothetical protein
MRGGELVIPKVNNWASTVRSRRTKALKRRQFTNLIENNKVKVRPRRTLSLSLVRLISLLF